MLSSSSFPTDVEDLAIWEELVGGGEMRIHRNHMRSRALLASTHITMHSRIRKCGNVDSDGYLIPDGMKQISWNCPAQSTDDEEVPYYSTRIPKGGQTTKSEIHYDVIADNVEQEENGERLYHEYHCQSTPFNEENPEYCVIDQQVI